VLRISAVKQSDQGTYFCRATNQNGETDSQRVTIYIERKIKNIIIVFIQLHQLIYELSFK